MFEIIKKYILLHSSYNICIPTVIDDNYWTFSNFWHVVQIAITACAMQHWQSLSCQRRERFRATSDFSHHHSAATHHHLRRSRDCWHTYENSMHAKQINVIFYIFFFNYLLYVLGIVLNCILQNNSYCLHQQYFFI